MRKQPGETFSVMTFFVSLLICCLAWNHSEVAYVLSGLLSFACMFSFVWNNMNRASSVSTILLFVAGIALLGVMLLCFLCSLGILGAVYWFICLAMGIVAMCLMAVAAVLR